MSKRIVGIFALSTSLLFPSNASAAEDYLLSVNMNDLNQLDFQVKVVGDVIAAE